MPEIILISMGLLTLAMIAAGLLRNFSIPYTVLLVVIGIALAELSHYWTVLEGLRLFTLSPDLVFFVFLPALIFESGLSLNARQLIRDLAPILTLAVPALLISTTLVGFSLWGLLDLELAVALLFGALISATDPVAVVALFRELGAPLRLNVLVEGESLFNDATAIVVFGILLSLAVEGQSVGVSETLAAVGEFIRVFIGGTLVGILTGLAVSEMLHRLNSGVSAVLAMSIVTAYASFIIGEHSLHVSGVMATVSAAVTLNVYGLPRIGIDVRHSLKETWELVGLVANSMLFLLVGLSINLQSMFSHSLLILLVVVVVLLARAATVYSLTPLTTRLFRLPAISLAERHIMWWGGLKGGLAIAIVLSIPESMPGRELLINLTLGVVLFTLMVNAWSIRPLMHALKLDRMTDDEQLELDRGLQRAGHSALAGVADYRDSGVLPADLYADIEHSIDTTFNAARPDIARGQSRRELYLTALQIEIDHLNRLYELGIIDQYTLTGISHSLQTDREAHSLPARHRSGLDPVIQQAETASIFENIEQWVLRHLRERNWAIGWLARYQRLRLLQQVQRNLAGVVMAHAVLDQLSAVADSDQILVSYRRRLEHRRAQLRSLSEEFPRFFQSIESELFLRSALVAARIDIEHQHQHGQIGVKALNHIQSLIHSELNRIRSNAGVRLQSDCLELIADLPLFEGLSRPVLELLARRARAVTFLEGDIIIGQGEHGDALYLIDHGRAKVSIKDEQGRIKHLGSLGPGDFFGEMALLGDHVRSASVVASTAVTLLRLSRQHVLDIAEQHDEVRQRIEQVNNQRSSGI